MKTLLLITTALVALGAGPVFAAGAKTMQSSGKMMQNSATTAGSSSMSGTAMNGTTQRAEGCPANAPRCGGLVAAPDGRLVKPPRAQQDARERPVTQQLNLEAQQTAGVPGAPGPSGSMQNQSGAMPAGQATGAAAPAQQRPMQGAQTGATSAAPAGPTPSRTGY